VTVNLDNLYITDVTQTATVINPLLGETAQISFALNRDVAEARVRWVPELSPLKEFPDQTPELDAVRTIELRDLAAGRRIVIWYGKDDSGHPLPQEAYIYVIEAKTASGRFEKFNQFLRRKYTSTDPVQLTLPVGATDYDPYVNEFVSHTFSLVTGPGRTSFRVEYTNSQNETIQLWPQRDALLTVGDNTVFWDGRDASGNLVTDIVTINYLVAGFVPSCDPCGQREQTSFHGLKRNHVIVTGTTPEVPLLSIKSDPYIVHLSYGHITELEYTLGSDAEVTVTVQAPDGTQKTLLSGQRQTAGDYGILWDGTNDAGRLYAVEGSYTFTVTAFNPASGASTIRRGSVIVRK
jgi:flagellar hook assembly protein FlgD